MRSPAGFLFYGERIRIQLSQPFFVNSLNWLKNIIPHFSAPDRPHNKKNGPSVPRSSFIQLAFFLPKNHPEILLFPLSES
jgi:hypothetical protein